MPEILTPQNRTIAYHLTSGSGPAVVFLGGFMSDMEGTKALHLENWAKSSGRAFLRFDYSGHGVSGGAFEDGAIGDWFEDAQAVLGLVEGPVVLVGSSMGGWISLLIARAMPNRVAGMVTIAAAPDFTEDGFWAGFDLDARNRLMTEGVVLVPSDYGAPYPITQRLIGDGRDQLVLRTPLALPFPVRFLQGTKDTSVSRETALQLFDHAEARDKHLTFVEGADHSFSSPDCLSLLEAAIGDVTVRANLTP